ncbi:MAG: RES family NAD+ phosphorylase [Hyphomonadaceae bacterium]|nr:RES family NAD+ phosphorylase [Hyphomonadaceae bacterium]
MTSPPLFAVHQTDTVRLIPTAYYKPPVLKPLVDTDEEFEILAAFEGLTNQRLSAEAAGLSDLESRELIFNAFGQTYINAAFSYTRPEGNRFNDAGRGAWYAAFEDLTAIEEVGYHRTRELTRIGVFEDEAIYQVLLAAFIGDFHDVRGFDPATDFLGAEPSTAYPAGQALAQTLRGDRSRGIVYSSVRRPKGTCLVAFQPHLVQNVRPGAKWKLTWSGKPQFTATAV